MIHAGQIRYTEGFTSAVNRTIDQRALLSYLPVTVSATIVAMSDFAARLNKLFETVHPPGRKPHTNAEVANALVAAGHHISKPYISLLRSGQRCNPSDETVAAFAKFFKVEPAYFFNDVYATKVDHDLELVTRLQGYGLRRLTTRAFDLSEESQALLTTLAEKLRAAEGLPEIPPDA